MVPLNPTELHTLLRSLPHRPPFVALDQLVEVVPGERGVAIKAISGSDPQLKGHFPGEPLLPGVLIAEAAAQLAGLVIAAADPEDPHKRIVLMGLDRMRFRQPVRPGDRLELVVTCAVHRGAMWRFRAEGRVDGARVASGEVTLAEAPRGAPISA